jgi:hypothetical protein
MRSSWTHGLRNPVTLDDRRAAETQSRTGRQTEQSDPLRRDVLAHLPG